jgi:hypothetical protein
MGMDRLKSLFSWRKLPGHAIWLAGLIWKLSDIGGRLDFLSRVVEGMGGTPAMVAGVLISPWTSIGLIVAGLGYVVLVGEPPKGVQRHQFWPYLGWAIFAVSTISMVTIVGYGALELALRRAHDEGAAGIARGTPSDNTPSRPQRPLTFGDNQSLQPDQIRILKDEIPKISDMLRHDMTIYMAPPAAGVRVDPSPFTMIFERNGIPSRFLFFFSRCQDDQGLIIFVKDLNDVMPSAQKFAQILTIADIKYTMRAAPTFVGVSDTHWVLFFGPIPFD